MNLDEIPIIIQFGLIGVFTIFVSNSLFFFFILQTLFTKLTVHFKKSRENNLNISFGLLNFFSLILSFVLVFHVEIICATCTAIGCRV